MTYTSPLAHPQLSTYRDVIQSSSEVKATGFGLIVPIALQLQPSISEDGGVIPPGWFGEVHVAAGLEEPLLYEEEETACA